MDEASNNQPATAAAAANPDASATIKRVAAHVTFGFATIEKSHGEDKENLNGRKRVCSGIEDDINKCQSLDELASYLKGIETIQGRTEAFTGEQIAAFILNPATVGIQITSTHGIRTQFEKLKTKALTAGISACSNFEELSHYLKANSPVIPSTAYTVGYIRTDLVCKLLLEIKKGVDHIIKIPSAYGLRAKVIALDQALKAEKAAVCRTSPGPNP